MSLPEYIVQRLRQEPPAGCSIIARTTPIVSFGDASSARVATLGLNPSRREFYEQKIELDGDKRRFETLDSLGADSLVAATDEQLTQIVERCNAYFRGNPYRGWFNPLEELLQTLGASYEDGSACHLDLSQWATDPTWNGLPKSARVQITKTEASRVLRRRG